MKIARIYLRVSTEEQDLTRQTTLVDQAKASGYYIAGVYAEKASGARVDRPELLRMIADLQNDDVVIAEKIDRISRLPLCEAETLIESITKKGARLCVPGIVDLSDIDASGVARIVLDSIQQMLLRVALQTARDDYDERRRRQKEGVRIAQKLGKYKGGKNKLTADQIKTLIELEKIGVSKTEIARRLNITRQTVYAYLAAA